MSIKLRGEKYLIDGLKKLCMTIQKSEVEILSVLEVGSYNGESTQIFAKAFPKAKIIAVDPWEAGYDTPDLASIFMDGAESEFDQVAVNHPNIVKVKKYSKNAVNDYEDKSLCFVYIDGKHTYESVNEDIHIWIKKVKDGGFLGFHDWDNISVNKAIIENLGYPDFQFEDTSVLFQIRRNIKDIEND